MTDEDIKAHKARANALLAADPALRDRWNDPDPDIQNEAGREIGRRLHEESEAKVIGGDILRRRLEERAAEAIIALGRWHRRNLIAEGMRVPQNVLVDLRMVADTDLPAAALAGKLVVDLVVEMGELS